jgi:hypothetical protein
MKDPKFSVGDVLKPVLDDTGLIKCHVMEIIVQVCPAKIEQVTYLCRIHTKHYARDPASMTRENFRFHEIELEIWKPKEKEE